MGLFRYTTEMPDHKEAVKWYKLSAEHGDASSTRDVHDLVTDPIKLSAEQGDAKAQFNLGLLLQRNWSATRL